MNKKPSTIKQVLALQNQPIQELKQLWQQLFDEPATVPEELSDPTASPIACRN